MLFPKNNFSWGRGPRGVMVKALDCGIVVSKFAQLRSLSDKYPWERHEPPYPPSYGLNIITTVHLGGWIWNWITHEGWYAIYQKNQLQFCSMSWYYYFFFSFWNILKKLPNDIMVIVIENKTNKLSLNFGWGCLCDLSINVPLSFSMSCMKLKGRVFSQWSLISCFTGHSKWDCDSKISLVMSVKSFSLFTHITAYAITISHGIERNSPTPNYNQCHYWWLSKLQGKEILFIIPWWHQSQLWLIGFQILFV